jgi:hypothetical protein
MSEADPIPAVPEEEASGQTAEIFADLRTTLGVPFVNLIWRHLATIPDALPAIWSLVRPLYLSGELEARGADLRAAAAVPGIEPLPEAAWDCAGLDSGTRGEIAQLIEAYNRANSVNFLALATATLVLRGERPGAGTRRRPAPARRNMSEADARPLPSLAMLPGPVQSLVQDFDALGRLGPSEAIASLYRHLAHWPAFLSVAYAALLPQHRAGTLQTAQHTLIVEGRGIASEELLPLLATDAFALDAKSRGRALASLDDFTSLMIGRMTVMGTALRTLLAK